MKLYFGPDETISKITKKIAKVPSYKKIIIEIDPSHIIFQNERRGNYLLELIQENNIQATFIAQNFSIKRYLDKAKLPYINQYSNFWEKIWHEGFQYRKKAKNAHKDMLVKKNSLSVFLIIAEFGALCLALYTFWTLISPNVVITVTPQYSVESFMYNFRYYSQEDIENANYQSEQEYLTIPMQRESIQYQYDMSINVENSTYEIENATGVLRLENSLPYPFSLLPRTKFVIDDDIIFTSLEQIEIPAGTTNAPGIATIDVVANSNRENGIPIGADGNITKGSEFIIKNLSESATDRKILGYAENNFIGGNTITKGTVIQNDIDQIEQKIINSMNDKKREHIIANYNIQERITMPFDEMTALDIQDFLTTSSVGDIVSLIEGKVNALLGFRSIARDDIEKGIYTYLDQRDPNAKRQYDINRSSITFYDPILQKIEEPDIQYYIIPTHVELIHHYDFVIDPYQITLEMKDKIVGKSKQEAIQIIKDYEEVGAVSIRISPSRFTLIPSSKSRIIFRESTQ